MQSARIEHTFRSSLRFSLGHLLIPGTDVFPVTKVDCPGDVLDALRLAQADGDGDGDAVLDPRQFCLGLEG